MIIAGRLGDGYDLNAMFAQLADRKLHVGAVAEETVERVEYDVAERPIGVAGAFHHLLESGSSIVSRGGGFDILLDDDPAVGLAMGPGDVALRWQRHIVRGLPAGADPQVQRHAIGFDPIGLDRVLENMLGHRVTNCLSKQDFHASKV